jgi:hypothetical protein
MGIANTVTLILNSKPDGSLMKFHCLVEVRKLSICEGKIIEAERNEGILRAELLFSYCESVVERIQSLCGSIHIEVD